MEPDPARHFVGPELGPNCLQSLSTDVTSRPNVKLNVQVKNVYGNTIPVSCRLIIYLHSILEIYKPGYC